MSFLFQFLLMNISFAAPVGDPSEASIVEAVRAELERNQTSLALPNAPPLYHLRYHVLELGRGSAVASLGALLQENTTPQNLFAVEARVGDASFDNTGFVGWQNGFTRGSLPLDVTDFNVGQIAWWSTDRAYKHAVEQFARKKAQFTPPDNYPGDYQMTGANRGSSQDVGLVSFGPLRDRAIRLSEGLRAAKGLELGEVHVATEQGNHLVLDTEGTEVKRSLSEITFRAVTHIRAPDGGLLTDHRSWSVANEAELASEAEMVAEISEMMAEIEKIRAAEPFAGEYVGPVLFEGEAARDLFRYLLVPQVEGTPPEVPFEAWFGDLGRMDDSVRIGRRVLPFGWSVVDDPRGESGPGYFEFDLEGSPSSRVELVSNGIVRRVLMSRVPRKGVSETTGHARGYPGQRAVARASQVEVTPASALTEKKLLKKALQAAEAYGNDWVFVVRRLQDPGVMTAGSDGWYQVDDRLSLPPPVAVYKVQANGSEQRLRGVRFSGVNRWLLRDILASGVQTEGSYLASLGVDGYYSSPLEGHPTRIVAPSVLIGEMELIASPGDPKSVPILKEVSQ